MKTWVKALFGIEKPVSGMCHMQAMPADPQFNAAVRATAFKDGHTWSPVDPKRLKAIMRKERELRSS